MLRMYYKTMCFLCVAAVLGVFAGNAAADYLKIYDFDDNVGATLTVGSKLIGQDNWIIRPATTINEIYVRDNTAGWSGKFAETITSTTHAYRYNDLNWSYSLQKNLDFDFSAIVKAQGTKIKGSAGLICAGGINYLPLMTLDVLNTNKLHWGAALDSYPDRLDYSITIPADGIYLLGLKVTAKGDSKYDYLPYYMRLDVADPEPVYLTAGKKELIGLTQDVNLLTGFYLLEEKTTTGGIARIDEYRISQVPEPGTLALLASGLIGLLCYAWRKRK